MESLFVWWQWTFIVLGFSLICVLVELVLVYLILRVRKKPKPFGWPLLNKGDQNAGTAPRSTNTTKEKGEPVDNKMNETLAQDIQRSFPPPKLEFRRVGHQQNAEFHRIPPPPKTEQPIRVSQPLQAQSAGHPGRPLIELSRIPSRAKVEHIDVPPLSLTGVEPAQAQNYELVKEVEANLIIAATAVKGKLVSFCSDIIDANSNWLNSLSSQIQEDLSEAYTDIRLANTLVWLSNDMGRQSSETENGYLELCNKIAERLESVVLGLMNSEL
jgi:hypothetical protein